MFNQFIDYHLKMVKEINDFVDKYNSSVFLFGAYFFSVSNFIWFKNRKNKVYLDNSPIKIEKRLYGTNLLVKSPKILKEYSKPLVILRQVFIIKKLKMI